MPLRGTEKGRAFVFLCDLLVFLRVSVLRGFDLIVLTPQNANKKRQTQFELSLPFSWCHIK